MKILVWHVHGSYMTALVQGTHQYYVPVVADRSTDGLGRAQTWDWPSSVVELTPHELARVRFDVVILQRRRELDLVREWLGREPGIDLPALYLEHDPPQGLLNEMRHPMVGNGLIPVVHVTHFNRLFWDCGNLPTYVIDHGIPDPGYRYGGDIPHGAIVVNEPLRRARVTGTDLIDAFLRAAPMDIFGMGVAALGGYEDLPQHEMHAALARRRVYVHPMRWTSLGLSLIEAMLLGLPVVALATTEASVSVPAEAGVISTNVDELIAATRRFIEEPARARAAGLAARRYALAHFGLERFLASWDRVLEEVRCSKSLWCRNTQVRSPFSAASTPAVKTSM